MTEETENLILRLLRDIRGEVADIKKTVEGHDANLQNIDRRLGDLTESAAQAMGMAAYSHIAQENLGERLDEMRVVLDRMKNRLDEVESRS